MGLDFCIIYFGEIFGEICEKTREANVLMSQNARAPLEIVGWSRRIGIDTLKLCATLQPSSWQETFLESVSR